MKAPQALECYPYRISKEIMTCRETVRWDLNKNMKNMQAAKEADVSDQKGKEVHCSRWRMLCCSLNYNKRVIALPILIL